MDTEDQLRHKKQLKSFKKNIKEESLVWAGNAKAMHKRIIHC